MIRGVREPRCDCIQFVTDKHDLTQLPHVSTTDAQRRSPVTLCLRKANICGSIVKKQQDSSNPCHLCTKLYDVEEPSLVRSFGAGKGHSTATRLSPLGCVHTCNVHAYRNTCNVPAYRNIFNVPAYRNICNVPAYRNTCNVPAYLNTCNVPAYRNICNVFVYRNTCNVPAYQNTVP